MSVHSFRASYGDNCFFRDSSWKRYQRHLHGDTVIFNYNSGIQCENYNGGFGFGGGFWGNLGAGLGMGLGNWLMGGLDMFGGLGGAGMWNFASPWGGGSLGGGARRSSRNSDGDNDASVRSNRRNKKAKDDIDNPKIADFLTRINDLNKDNINAEYPKLKEEIEKAKNDTDDLNKEHDLKSYDNLLKALETAKTTAQKGGTTTIDGNAVVSIYPDDKMKIKLGDNDINSVDELEKLDPNTLQTEINKLSPKTAQTILLNWGYIDTEAGSTEPKMKNFNGKDYLCGKLSNKYSILLLLQKANVVVEVEKNPKAPDQWIAGPISNVALNDGKISYDVDCTKTGVYYKGKYKFSQKAQAGNEYSAQQLDSNHRGTFNSDKTYYFRSEKKPLDGTGVVARNGQ